MVSRIGVVGVGLIGGSVGLALRAGDREAEVVGFDTDPRAVAAATERGAVTWAATSLAECVGGVDLVVLATPVDETPQILATMAAWVRPEAIVTDVGSAKTEVVAAGERLLGDRFVGGHPMAGSERHGIEAADAGLFVDAWWIITPTAVTSSRGYAEVGELATAVGATPIALAPGVHDDLIARLSHVPQVAASALVHGAITAGGDDTLLGLAAGGFRDVTRIAASDPDLWVAIIRANRRAILESLEGLRGGLGDAAGMVARGRWGELRAWLEAARSARVELFAKTRYAGEPVALSLMIPDRPGVLAQVTTAAGGLGVNIEDLRIAHSTEGGSGRLELVVSGVEAAELLVGELMRLGYRVARGGVEA